MQGNLHIDAVTLEPCNKETELLGTPKGEITKAEYLIKDINVNVTKVEKISHMAYG